MDDKNKKGHGNSDDHANNFVEIIVNDETYKIHRGRRSVVEIKTAGEVPLADKLEQVIDGTLVPLDDDGSIVIKGGEEFKSHVPSGGAS
tara:strand:- start:219 stop:485 length:267 start_codon:yes stop_codon:yes gene_type:complete